jgi:hypothetical protein
MKRYLAISVFVIAFCAIADAQLRVVPEHDGRPMGSHLAGARL